MGKINEQEECINHQRKYRDFILNYRIRSHNSNLERGTVGASWERFQGMLMFSNLAQDKFGKNLRLPGGGDQFIF